MRRPAWLVIVVACGGGSSPAPDADLGPQTFCWTVWGTAGPDGADAHCILHGSPGFEQVSFQYRGEHAFVQVGDNGTNFWAPGNPYINTVTGTAPPLAGLVGFAAETSLQTLTFDTPVTGLAFAVTTMGDASTTVRYDFDHSIALLSEGAGFGGDGTLVVEGDNVLAGSEGHGVVQFPDSLTTLTWTISGVEAGCVGAGCDTTHAFHGFTVGIPPQR